MAIWTPNNTADLKTAIQNSVGGDTIKVAPGKYGSIVFTTAINKSSDVTIASANVSNPAYFGDGQLKFGAGCSHLIIDGINWIGSAVESTKNGVTYPASDDPLYFDSASFIKLKNVLFQFYRNGLRFQSCISDIEVSYCEFSQIGIDPLKIYGSCDNINLHHNVWRDFRIDGARRTEDIRHPDGVQARTNKGQVNNNPMNNLIIEDNYFDDPSGYSKAFFLSNEGQGGGVPTPGIGYTNSIIRRNYIAVGRFCAIQLDGGTNQIIQGNVIRAYNTGVNESPIIKVRFSDSSGTVSNNVQAIRRDANNNILTTPIPTFTDGAVSSNFTVSGNKASDSEFPTGWVDLKPGVNVGPYTDGSANTPVTPTRPTVEWDNPPANTDSGHGRFGTVTKIEGLLPARYTAVLIIPSDAPAFSDVSVGAQSGNEASNARWWKSGNAAPGKFKFANPLYNAAGAIRLEMIGSITDLDTWSVAAEATLSGLTWEWKFNTGTVYSGQSTYTGSVTAPVAPPTPVLSALTDTQWEFVGSVKKADGFDDRFIQDLRILSTGPAYVGIQWTPLNGDGVWRDLSFIETDSSGAKVWRLLPLVNGGTEHTAQYQETKNIYIRYSDGTTYSPQSTTYKGFTGPTFVSYPGYEPGTKIRHTNGTALTIAGTRLSIPQVNGPMAVNYDDVSVSRNNTIITVTLPNLPPIGATNQEVVYNSKKFYPDSNGIVTFTALNNNPFFLIRGTNENKIGPSIYFFIPDDVFVNTFSAAPDAIGFGATATGARNDGTVTPYLYFVTNLSDNIATVGSLRWCLAQPTPAFVVPVVEGGVKLTDQIVINNSNLTILGNLAPGKGFWIERARINIRGSNIIIYGLRCYPGGSVGSGSEGQAISSRDGLSIGSTDTTGPGSTGVDRIFIDRSDFMWGCDECLTCWVASDGINRPVTNVTFSRLVVGQGLAQVGHEKHDHSMSLLIGQHSHRISILQSLIGESLFRNPQIQGNCTEIEINNCWVANYGGTNYIGDDGDLVNGNGIEIAGNDRTVHVINCVIETGPLSVATKKPINVLGSNTTYACISGNIWTNGNGVTTSVQQNMLNYTSNTSHLNEWSSSPVFTPSSNTIPTANVKSKVAGEAGAPLVTGGLCDPAASYLASAVAGTRTNGISALKNNSTTVYPTVIGAASIINANGLTDAYMAAYGSNTIVALDLVKIGSFIGYYHIEACARRTAGENIGF